MKKLVSFLLAFCILFVSFCSCSKDANIDSHSTQVSSTIETSTEALVNITTNENTTEENTESETVNTDKPDNLQLDSVQKNAISILNYLTVLSQEINESKNNRLYLENAYSNIYNNTHPNAIDKTTQARITSMLDTIEKYRMIDVKRERIKYIYDQNQAQAFKKAIPNPMSILNIVQSGDYIKMAISAVSLVMNSASSYSEYKNEVSLQYLQDGWELDDEESSALHESRKSMFTYMLTVVRDNGLPGDYALNENSVTEFVKWQNNPNVTRRIDFLEDKEETYKALGTYWLVLADSYYENGDYQKCLAAVANYEKNSSKIFRKDYDYARTLPKAIYSAKNTLNKNKYVKYAESACKNILANIDTSDWALRYFVAQIYMDLYSVSNDNSFLERAYSEVYKNINECLIDIQKELNAEYLSDIQKKEIPEGATKREKNEVKEYNKALVEERKIALPPISEPLYLNCELLFALAEKLNIDDAEKKKITNMLSYNGESLFLDDVINSQFSFTTPFDASNTNVSFDGKVINLPANIISDNTSVTVIITEGKKSITVDDWKVKEVNRNKTDSPKDYIVVLSSEKIKDCDFTASSKVKITLKCRDSNNAIEYNFDAVAKKKLFVEVIEFVKKP